MDSSSAPLGDLRYIDLLAKTARTSFKDTQSVLLAIELLREVMQLAPARPAPQPYLKASPQAVEACEQAHRAFLDRARTCPRAIALLAILRALKQPPCPSNPTGRPFP